MNTTRTITTQLLAAALAERTPALPGPLTLYEWNGVYSMAARQGVLAVVFEAVGRLPEELRPPGAIRIQWAYNAERLAARYRRQLAAAAELTEALAVEGIRTVVLKGFALSGCYPVAEHRECGDFDCYLCGAYARGNDIARRMGARVDDSNYKHSHILYKGLSVENHRYCLGVRGDRRLQRLERDLRRIASDHPAPEYVADTKILIPPADFTALFLLRHTLQHFLLEGITLRHLCDWGLFLKREGQRVDRAAFDAAARANDLHLFAATLTAICTRRLGIELPDVVIEPDERFADRVLDDIYDCSEQLYTGERGKWRLRAALLRNIYRNRWKFNDLYGRHYLGEIARYAYGFLADRQPAVE